MRTLGLANSYNFLVLNPHWSSSTPAYGYRAGFSDKEMAMIYEDRDSLMQVRGSALLAGVNLCGVFSVPVSNIRYVALRSNYVYMPGL